MPQPLGSSGQAGSLGIAGITLKCTVMRLRKRYNNADTTVEDDGWSQLCPVYRDWSVDCELPWNTTDENEVDDLFDTSDYDSDTPSGQDVSFNLPNGGSYSGTACLDGDYEIDDSAKDAVRLRFSLKGTGALEKD